MWLPGECSRLDGGNFNDELWVSIVVFLVVEGLSLFFRERRQRRGGGVAGEGMYSPAGSNV